ncbi:ribosome maturation factor RimM [Hathewaya histolytica]|uniref:ribosome maturation factor RimM n=1 Tax=Hathewaya histolytica TaxID=1498 RepID=UPI003B67C7A6
MKEYLVIGQISKPHGVRGEMKIYPLTNDYKRFKELSYILIDGKEYKIESCKLQTDRVILKLEGIETIEDVMKYKNKQVSIKREDGIELSEGEYYIADLIGCTVFDTEDTFLGEVYDVIETGSNDVYWVKSEKEEVLIPAIASVVNEIIIEESKIIIKPVKEWM